MEYFSNLLIFVDLLKILKNQLKNIKIKKSLEKN